MIEDPSVVIEFWREAGPEKWFVKDLEFDAEIARQFGDAHELAAVGGFDDWAATPDGALALILILDQFSRNLHRDSNLAFAQDARCLKITRKVLEAGFDRDMPDDLRSFAYMPLMHSENLEDQELCIEKMREIGNDGGVDYGIIHRDIIKEFGRFPHRNAVLGRETTRKEQKFLDSGGFAG